LLLMSEHSPMTAQGNPFIPLGLGLPETLPIAEDSQDPGKPSLQISATTLAFLVLN
jgi:hypothetical protein